MSVIEAYVTLGFLIFGIAASFVSVAGLIVFCILLSKKDTVGRIAGVFLFGGSSAVSILATIAGAGYKLAKILETLLK